MILSLLLLPFLAAASNLEFSHHWPKATGVVYSGHPTEILIGALNKEELPQNIVYLSASFTNPSNFSQIYRNISGHAYEIVVGKNQVATLPFTLDFIGEPDSVGLVVYVHHYGNNRRLPSISVALKEVVQIKDKSKIFDWESLSIYVLAFIIPVALYYYWRGQEVVPVKVPKPVAKKVEIVDREASEVDLDWIPEHLRKDKSKNKK